MNSCTQCKNEKSDSDYRTIKNQLCKICIECSLINKIARDSKRCEHKLIKSQCIACKGSKICEHMRYKPQCHECNGCTICIHGKMKFQCKYCLPPKHVLINTILYNSKRTDIKLDRYDELNFINYDFINNLITTNKKCCYCSVGFQYLEYDSNLCTIERKNNSIGHIQSNCTLCCKKCNNKNKQVVLTA